MTSRGAGRTQPCSAADARTRVEQARLYLLVAETVLTAEPGAEATVATGNAVLAAIAAADAICCALGGSRAGGADHLGAADLLEAVTGDRRLAMILREVLSLKDQGHYGLDHVGVSRAKTATRKAAQLLAAAEERVR